MVSEWPPPLLEGGPRTLCLRGPAPNVMAFGRQQIFGNSRERATDSLLMVVSGRGHASGCVSKCAVTGLQPSLLIVWEQGWL